MKYQIKKTWLMQSSSWVIALLWLLVLCPHLLLSVRSNKTPPHIAIARKYVGTQEIGQNRGKLIDEWNKFVKNPVGSQYCAAFGSYVLAEAGVKDPNIRSGLAAKFKDKESIAAAKVLAGIVEVEAGDILIWQKGKTIFGHFGFASEDWHNAQGMSIQANSSFTKDTRDGSGVVEKPAKIEPFNYFRICRIRKVKY